MDIDIDCSQLRVGTVIAYKMRPGEMPTHPQQKERHGKIIKTVPGTEHGAKLVWIESLDEGYKGLTKSVLLEQIIRIEGDLEGRD
jgi:hypothetical protein